MKYLTYCRYLVLILLLSGCAELQQAVNTVFQQPEVSYRSISLGEINQGELILKPVFSVKNPNAFTLPVDKFNYQLSFNGAKMLDGATSSFGNLPALGSRDIELSIPVNREVFRSFKELLLNNKKLDYKISGAAEVMGLAIPFTKSDTFYRPSFSFGKLNVKQASFDSIKLEASVMINNPNKFSLPINDLGYAVSSGSKSLFSGNMNQQTISSGKSQLTIPLTIKPVDMFSNVLALLRNPNLPLTVSMQGPMIDTKREFNLNLAQFF